MPNLLEARRRLAAFLRRRRPAVSAADVRRADRPGARRPGAVERHLDQSRRPRLSVHRRRGVGKTSAARILAKALNCEKGPTPTPCNQCDICQSISTRRRRRRAGDRRRQQPRHRRDPPVAPERRRAAQPVAVQDLHHRRSPHAHPRGLQRPVEDARRAARAREVHLLHHRADEDPDHDPLAVPAVRFRGHPDPLDPPAARTDRGGRRGRGRAEALEVLARRAAGSMRDSQSLLGATAGVFAGPDHRGRGPRDARHGRRRAAGCAGRSSDRNGIPPRRWPISTPRWTPASMPRH